MIYKMNVRGQNFYLKLLLRFDHLHKGHKKKEVSFDNQKFQPTAPIITPIFVCFVEQRQKISNHAYVFKY